MANTQDALFHTIAKDYAAWLIGNDQSDSFEARHAFCKEKDVHPKLLEHNPLIASIEGIFKENSPFERMQGMNLEQYMRYHYYYTHLGFRYGAPHLQQQWRGHTIIKSPADCWVYQELIYQTKPDVLIELGVMFGGASVFFADIFEMMGHGELLGIDITLDKAKDVSHPRITYLEGSSVSDEMIEDVRKRVEGKKVMVIADSDHEKNHVLKELRLYAQFVNVGGYLIAEDSLNDVMGYHPVPNEGPQAAAKIFADEQDDFIVDLEVAEKYITTISPLGFLKRVK